MKVFNGAGVTGLGRAGLRRAGRASASRWSARPTTAAARRRTTTVYHGPDKADSARTLAAAIPGSRVELDPALTRTLEVVVGSSYAGAKPVTVAGRRPRPPLGRARDGRTGRQDRCGGPLRGLTHWTAGLAGERDPAQPLLTLHSALGRVELSGATTANWVAKSANLLVDGYGGPGRVGLLLPLHWQTVALLLAGVATGRHRRRGRRAGRARRCGGRLRRRRARAGGAGGGCRRGAGAVRAPARRAAGRGACRASPTTPSRCPATPTTGAARRLPASTSRPAGRCCHRCPSWPWARPTGSWSPCRPRSPPRSRRCSPCCEAALRSCSCPTPAEVDLPRVAAQEASRRRSASRWTACASCPSAADPAPRPARRRGRRHCPPLTLR